MLAAILAQTLQTVNIYSGSVLRLFDLLFRVSLCSTSSAWSTVKRCRYALVYFCLARAVSPSSRFC